MSSKVKSCGLCGSRLQYVQRSIEYHSVLYNEETEEFEFCALDNSYVDEMFDPYLECSGTKCRLKYNLNGTLKVAEQFNGQ